MRDSTVPGPNPERSTLHSVREQGRNAVSRAVPFVSTPDLTLFHPPSVYDFRERSEVFGPI
ncbi:hypothetical protein, partial [Natronobacterium gregoryi]